MIRIISQDGTSDINYANYDISCMTENILATPNFGKNPEETFFPIGSYKDHARAVEVLKQFRTNIVGRGDKAIVIYEMPKE